MTLRERLIEAETALHELQTGRGVAEVTDQNGERIRYVPAKKADLNQYINDLKRQINGQASSPMNVWGC